jgi:hypothetical protein
MDHLSNITHLSIYRGTSKHTHDGFRQVPPSPDIRRGTRVLAIAIWSIAGLLAAAWTGVVALLGTALTWTGEALRHTGALAEAPPAWPSDLPSWLSTWIEPSTWAAIGNSLREIVPPVLSWLPAAGTLTSWLEALVWIGWGLGMIALLVMAVGAHAWLRRAQRLVNSGR